MEVCSAIRQRIIAIDQKYESQPFVLFTSHILPNKGRILLYLEHSIKQVYENHKDPEDGLLYLKYSNLDPFGALA